MGSLFRAVPRNLRIAVAVVIPVLLLAAAAFASLQGPGPRKSTSVALNPTPSASSTPSVPVSAAPSPTDSSPSPVADTPSPAPAASPSSAPAATPTVIHVTAPTPTPTHAPVTQPPPTPTPTPSCDSSMVSNAISTDRSSYPSNVKVQITLTLTNHSQASCTYDNGSGTPMFCVDDSKGKEVWAYSNSCQGLHHTGGGTPNTGTLAAGTSQSFHYSWDRAENCYNCGGAQAPPSAGYKVTGGWTEGAPTASAPFQLG